jgi:hypothetical protein
VFIADKLQQSDLSSRVAFIESRLGLGSHDYSSSYVENLMQSNDRQMTDNLCSNTISANMPQSPLTNNEQPTLGGFSHRFGRKTPGLQFSIPDILDEIS